jgi:hypothetical protein
LDGIEDCVEQLYLHAMEIEQIMERLLGEMDSRLEDTKAQQGKITTGKEEMKAKRDINQRR